MKTEFSKIVLGSAVVIWAAGAVFGAYIVNEEREQLRELLAYIWTQRQRNRSLMQ